MQQFKSKKEVFNYIKQKFLAEGVEGIVIQGSTTKGKIKDFSDIDIIVFNNKKLKPYYELCLVNNKMVLITAYFYKPGKIEKTPKNEVVLYGNSYSQIEHKGNLDYTKEERIKRANQMFLDCLFKYLRSRDKSYLKTVDKYSRF